MPPWESHCLLELLINNNLFQNVILFVVLLLTTNMISCVKTVQSQLSLIQLTPRPWTCCSYCKSVISEHVL